MKKTLTTFAAIAFATLLSSCSGQAAVTPAVTITQTVQAPPPVVVTPSNPNLNADGTLTDTAVTDSFNTAWEGVDKNLVCHGWNTGASKDILDGFMAVAPKGTVDRAFVRSLFDEKCAGIN